MKQKLPGYYPGIIIFLTTFFIGLATFTDYGISWDEPAQRAIGLTNYNYVFNGDKSLLTFSDKEYGPGFEMPLIFLEKWLHLDNTRDIYHMRHLATHTFFLICALFGYLFLLRLFKNQFIACLGMVMLIFEPRIYAHSFFNTKDIPFLSAVLLSIAFCHLALERKKPLFYLLSGLICGYSTGIRIMGVIPSFFVFILTLSDLFISTKDPFNKRKILSGLLFFVAGFCVCLYAISPYLWLNPLNNLIEIYTHSAGRASGDVLFNGRKEDSMHLPWQYVPVWVGITTPILWLVSGALGLILICFYFFRSPVKFFFQNLNNRIFLLCALCFCVPVLAVIILHSTIYDDWRHMYFIYPPFVILAAYGMYSFWRYNLKFILLAIFPTQMIILSYFFIKNHPFEQVYFNSLVSHKKEYLRKSYDMDYWGVSMKQGLDTLLARDHSPIIKINNSLLPEVINNQLLLMKEIDIKRIKLVDNDEEADYRLIFFRTHPEDYNYPSVFYIIEVENNTILCVYKLH